MTADAIPVEALPELIDVAVDRIRALDPTITTEQATQLADYLSRDYPDKYAALTAPQLRWDGQDWRCQSCGAPTTLTRYAQKGC